MTEFLLFCIATIGLTSIIMHGMIFRPFREFVARRAESARERREQQGKTTGFRSPAEWLHELLNCAECTGFWCGLFCGLIIVTPVALQNAIYSLWQINIHPVVGRYIIIDSNFIPAGQSCYLILLWLCCGFGGSFLATLGSNIIDLIFYRKMNALRHLEEQEHAMSNRNEVSHRPPE